MRLEPTSDAPVLVVAGLVPPTDLPCVAVDNTEALVAALESGAVDAVLAAESFCPLDALFQLVNRPAWVPALLVVSKLPSPTALDTWLRSTNRQRAAAERVESAEVKHARIDTWASDLRRELSEALHDLKTPVAVIEGYCSNLLDGLDGPLADDVTKSVERIRFSAGMMTEVIGRTQGITAKPMLPSTTRPVAPAGGRTKIDLVDLTMQVIELFEREASAADVKITQRCAEAVPSLWGDAARLNQLFVNLVGNALRFTRAGGRIDIEISPQDRDRADGTVRISVQDSGPGISPDIHGSMFTAGVSGSGRAGLGLAIVQQIADEHGAQLSVDPGGDGHGATFHVVLPVDPRSRRAASLEVLLIEDPSLAGQLLIELRNRYGNRLPVGRPTDMEVLASEIVRSSSTIVFAGQVEASLQQRTMDLDLAALEGIDA